MRNWKRHLAFAIGCAAMAFVASLGARALVLSTPPEDGVVTPASDLSRFRLIDGFRIELVASEPLIDTPVAMTFDGDGRLWVVEMSSYMPNFDAIGERVPIDRIVILTDTNGDGVMDCRTVFLDRLVLPRAVLPCRGGALVLEPPTLYFCADRDGDGVADSKEALLAGFAGKDNPEHAGNGLIYGVDNWVSLSQHGLRFRFDGQHIQTQPTPAHGQWGVTQDDAGRLFYTPNSEALQGDAYPKHYAARNPNMSGAAGINIAVCKDQTVWPSHPTPAVNRGYQPGTLRNDGRLANHTAACGPVIFRSHLFGEEYYGNAFVCEAAGNLVKRIVLSESNGTPTGRPAYKDRDFLTSTDVRFRPVNTCVGPDGALYIADMYRGVIQHKTYITDYLREQSRKNRLERPLGYGRIYRIVPTGRQAPGAQPGVSSADDERLVSMLSHLDGWWRDAAQQRIVEAKRPVGGRVRELASRAPDEFVRMRAMWTLEGLEQATLDDCLTAMTDRSPWVRCAGLRIGERWANDAAYQRKAVELSDDTSRIVRVQAAASIGERAETWRDLIGILRKHGDDAIVRGAAVSGLGGGEWRAAAELLSNPEWPTTAWQRDVLSLLCDCVLKSEHASAKLQLIEAAGKMAAGDDARAKLLLTALAKQQRLDSQAPRTVSIGGVPTEFLKLAEMSTPLGKAAVESSYYLSWPGRTRVNPPRKLRPLTDVELSQFERGRFLYTDCVGCHGESGTGIAGTAPPLAGSARVQGPASRLARILLHGFEGEIEREGVKYNGAMQPAPRSNDADLASLMTYIRRAWGNAGDPITEAQVSQTRLLYSSRRGPWKTEELERIP